MKRITLSRNCPKCNKLLTYKSPISFEYAINHEQKCKDCCDRKNKISNEIIEQILLLNEQGILNREISRILGLHHKTVNNYIKKHNRKSIFANQSIDIVSKDEARCCKCKNIKSIKEFQHGRKGQQYEYKFSYCNECRRKQSKLNLNNDIEKYLSNKFNVISRRAKKSGIIFSISKDDFINQYYTQDGKCFYTDELMICKVGQGISRYSFSVDKIIPILGYSAGNTVFCINKINICKNDLNLKELESWMTPIYNRIINYYGAKSRIEVGDKVKVDDSIRENFLNIEHRTIFIVERIGQNERICFGSMVDANLNIIKTNRQYYTDVWLKDIRDLNNSNAKIYGPISEMAMCYPWQLLRD